MREKGRAGPTLSAVIKAVYHEVFTFAVIAAWASTSVVVALAGPFGTFGARPFWWGLSYWASLIGVAIVLAVCIRVFFRFFVHGLKAWVEDVAVAVILSLVFGPMVLLINRSLTAEQAPGGLGVVLCIAVVFVVAISTIALRHALINGSNVQAEAEQDRLLQRLDVAADVRIKAVSSDNHHVMILTNDGQSHRLLMRLRDAIDEIDREVGFCIHRSHWVATHAIERLHQRGSKESVELSCGAHLPVGPKYRNNLVQSGHITDEGMPQSEQAWRVYR